MVERQQHNHVEPSFFAHTLSNFDWDFAVAHLKSNPKFVQALSHPR
jgi:hypothetical protein